MNPMMWPGAPLTKALVIPFSVYLCGLGNICKLVSFVFVLKWWNMKKFSVKINNENVMCASCALDGQVFMFSKFVTVGIYILLGYS